MGGAQILAQYFEKRVKMVPTHGLDRIARSNSGRTQCARRVDAMDGIHQPFTAVIRTATVKTYQKNWCRRTDSNREPTHYKCVALPIVLRRPIDQGRYCRHLVMNSQRKADDWLTGICAESNWSAADYRQFQLSPPPSLL